MTKNEIQERLADLIQKILWSISDTPWALRPADECYYMAEKLIAHGVTFAEEAEDDER